MSGDPVSRDALALITCELRGDEAGADIILDECDLREVARFLAGLAAGGLRRLSGNAPTEDLVEMARKHLLRLADDDSGGSPG
jgi:hypothetical protein